MCVFAIINNSFSQLTGIDAFMIKTWSQWGTQKKCRNKNTHWCVLFVSLRTLYNTMHCIVQCIVLYNAIHCMTYNSPRNLAWLGFSKRKGTESSQHEILQSIISLGGNCTDGFLKQNISKPLSAEFDLVFRFLFFFSFSDSSFNQ